MWYWKKLRTVVNFNPKEITAIDISDVSIEKAKKNLKISPQNYI